MKLDPEQVRANARLATTEDLLDRVTVYREGMDPEALPLLEEELARRGIGPARLADHAGNPEREVLRGGDGLPRGCSWCSRPAVGVRRVWHRVWGLIPLFPRHRAHCREHGE